MPIQNYAPLKGCLVPVVIESAALTNQLGDPQQREVVVYLPEGYAEATDTYPLFVDLVGFTGCGPAHVGWKAFAETVPQRVERLIAEGLMGKVILAFPDCFTALGGNQYIDSDVMGQWATFLTEIC